MGYLCWDTALEASSCIHHSLHQTFRRGQVAPSSQTHQFRPEGWGQWALQMMICLGEVALVGVPCALLAQGNPKQVSDRRPHHLSLESASPGSWKGEGEGGIVGWDHSLGQAGYEFQWLWVTHKEGLQRF